MRPSPALALAVAAAWAGTLGLVLVHLALSGTQAWVPATTLPSLVALGASCSASLTLRRRPPLAWLAATLALAVATVDIAATARADRSSADPEAWRWAAILLCLEAIAASSVAVAFAAERPRRLGRFVGPLGVLGVALVVGASIWALAMLDASPDWLGDPSPLGSLGLVTRSFLVVTLTFVALGCVGELRPSVDRARRRLEIEGPPPRTATGRIHRLVALGRVTIDELAPGRSRAEAAARSERSRLAGELHAEVVPAVRRALRDAERGGSPEQLAVSLHGILDDVDRLIASRHQIVLDAEGLVPAIEWLAERVEDRSDVRVEIEVAGDRGPDRGAPSRAVAEAAYRVVELALDNVVRHAPGAAVRVAASVDARCVAIAIVDDGSGLQPESDGRAPRAGRGLLDMRAAATAVGATVAVTAGDGGRGTVVRFDWPSH